MIHRNITENWKSKIMRNRRTK